MAHVKAKSSSHKTTNTTSTVTATTSTSSRAASSLAASRKLLKDRRSLPVIGATIAELIGTFLLVAVTISLTVTYGQLPIGFVSGITLAGIILLIGGLSGSHLNPVITIGAWVTRKISSVQAVGYIVAQSIGGYAAYSMVNGFLVNARAGDTVGNTSITMLTATPITSGKEMLVFFAELLGAAILAFGVATSLRIKRNRSTAALTAGFSLFIALTVAGSLTVLMGTYLVFLNPVISATASGFSSVYTVVDSVTKWNLWPISVYVIAPVIGGIVGFVLQDFLQSQSSDNSCEGCDNCNCGCCK